MEIGVQFKAGGSFVDLPPIFSSNSENVYVAWKNQILGYSTKTGAQFAVFKGIQARIVGFGVHYYNSFECVTACSSHGEVITWKIVTHFKMFNKKLDRNVKSFHLLPSDSKKIQALVSFINKNTVSFCLYDIQDLTNQQYGIQLNPSTPYYVDVCCDQYFAIAQRNVLQVIRIDEFDKTYTFSIENSRKFTSVVCHPEEEILLTGDHTGRVLLWHGIFTTKPSKAVFHWHTLPVRCICFSTSGSYFYSGGEESVLVQWQADNHLQKKFLPRLASTIAQISVSPNNTLIAVATADNGVKIIDSRFESVSLIQHLVIGNNFNSGIVYDPRTRTLVMNGNVGQIQFYSPVDNSLLYNVDVVGQNKISNERSCKIENTKVFKVAISKNGLWMATVEVRNDAEYSLEQRLKFWNFDTSFQNFKLNTCVEDPHLSEVNAIAFQPINDPNELKCVTVGADKKFKVWIITETETVERGKASIWSCLCVGYYHDLHCKSLSFSADGSLLAVSFNNILTTWSPDSCQLKCSLSHPACKTEITQTEFGNSTQCHLLVAASTDRLSVWNLLTLTMMWTVPVDVSILIADATTTNMAIFTTDRKVYVFAPMSPDPIYSSKIPRNHKNVSAAIFVPTKYSNDVRMQWYQRSPIYFIDSKRELHCLGCEEAGETQNQIENVETSAFSMMISKEQNKKSKTQEPVNHLYTKDIGQKNIKKYLEAPIQTMIPIRLMCGSLLKSMVLQKT